MTSFTDIPHNLMIQDIENLINFLAHGQSKCKLISGKPSNTLWQELTRQAMVSAPVQYLKSKTTVYLVHCSASGTVYKRSVVVYTLQDQRL